MVGFTIILSFPNISVHLITSFLLPYISPINYRKTAPLFKLVFCIPARDEITACINHQIVRVIFCVWVFVFVLPVEIHSGYSFPSYRSVLTSLARILFSFSVIIAIDKDGRHKLHFRLLIHTRTLFLNFNCTIDAIFLGGYSEQRNNDYSLPNNQALNSSLLFVPIKI